jgi:hypothetical protein
MIIVYVFNFLSKKNRNFCYCLLYCGVCMTFDIQIYQFLYLKIKLI